MGTLEELEIREGNNSKLTLFETASLESFEAFEGRLVDVILEMIKHFKCLSQRPSSNQFFLFHERCKKRK